MILKLFILYIYKCSFAFCILHAACCGMPAVTTCLHTLEMCIIVDAIVPKKVTFAHFAVHYCGVCFCGVSCHVLYLN